MSRLEAIRRAEAESHTAAYETLQLYAPGSWLSKPVKALEALLPLYADRKGLRVLDLGSGVGRNAIACARTLKGAQVTCVDILPMAIEKLMENAESLKYYLRGLFLSCGRITDPHAEAHIEFSLRSEAAAERLVLLMLESGLDKPGRSKRRDRFSVYYKSRDRISDMLTAMDAGALVFDYINRAIYKSLEWNERRAINMISGNINRSVIAGERQAAACRYLLENNKGAQLTSDLYETAILRVNNVNLSLSELAAVHNPPLTKSGLNNRLKRIIDIAEKNGFTVE